MVALQLKLPAALLKRIEEFRETFAVKPSRSEAIRFLIKKALDQELG
jgi:metal-responsive CopG/Arc/MetJ family transcriptional regulator